MANIESLDRRRVERGLVDAFRVLAKFLDQDLIVRPRSGEYKVGEVQLGGIRYRIKIVVEQADLPAYTPDGEGGG